MRILGLDLGTTSVGFALVEWQKAETGGTIIRAGVRIFPEGIVRDQSGQYPPNQTRRQKRLARRTLRRRRVRRRQLARILQDMELLPAFSKERCSAWAQAMKMDEANDPYLLRKRALTERLAPYELGRALYHLAKRRGFRGRDIEENADVETKKEVEGIKAEIAGLRDSMGKRTLGAHLAGLPRDERRRGRHTHRDMYADEFSRLWEAQGRFYPESLTEDRRAEIDGIVFNQRPTFWRLNTLGKCRFCPDQVPAPAGAWATQQWVMLEQVNKLRIAGGNMRKLDKEEWQTVVALAQQQATVSFGAIRKALKEHWISRGEDPKQTFNMEGSEKNIRGNALEAKLVKIFGEAWRDHPARERIRSELHQRLFHADYVQIGEKRIEIRRANEQLAARAQAAEGMVRDWAISAEEATALSEIALPAGWSRVSTKAIDAMLPEMEDGIGVGELTMSPEWEEWRRLHFPDMHRPTGEICDSLPSKSEDMPETRNPAVRRTLNEVRKVVNNLIRTYGKPDRIRVELARELRQPKKRREETDKRNRERERERKKAATELESNGIKVDGRNIEKWLLWKECRERCPYTDDAIGFDALFRQGLYDIEHIWPRSRSLDNGFMNKTLCQAEYNRSIKGNKTPFEIFGHDEVAFHTLKQRLEKCFGDPRHPKIKRFLSAEFAEAGTPEFEERQLRDTAYAARLVRDFLKKLYPDDGNVPPVETCNGSITAQLRDAWGLNTLLSDDNKKNRADHRHHAIDALAVAFATPRYVKRLSDWNRQWREGLRPELPKPWPTIKEDARRAINGIVVSHRVRKKVSGALHAETWYGDTGVDEATKSGVYRHYVTTKPVAKLSKGELSQIRDKAVREIVEAWVLDRGGDPKKAFPPYPRVSPNGPEIRKVRLTIKQQQQLMVKLPAGWADPGANHHMAVYREPDGTVSYEVVSLFEATRRLARHEPVVRKRSARGGALIMSLAPGDTLEFPPADGAALPAYRVVTGVWANGQIVLEEHTDASGNNASRPNPRSLLGRGAQKVSVDPIGRVRPAGD